MRLAGIDIGSNTTLLLIVENRHGEFHVLSDKIYFTRLAEGIQKTKQFSESALIRLEHSFSSLKEELNHFQPDQISLVATSASRQALNKDQLLLLGKKYDLFPIEIISPKREAELTFTGALFGLGHELDKILVVDIGGGSTELVSNRKSYSLDIGSVSLTERFLSSQSLSRTEKISLSQFLNQKLKHLETFLKEDYESLIFVAGTPVSLAFMEKRSSNPNEIHGLVLKEDQVDFWLEKLMNLSVEERKRIPHLPEYRSDVIVSGLALLKHILKGTGKKEFIVSATGVRYGLILEQLQKR